MKPLVIVNFKTYEQSIGAKGLKLAKICEEVSKKYDARVVICPQTADLAWFAKKVRIPIYAQHLDAIEPGRSTGFLSPAEARAEHVKGTLINHSEHPLSLKEIKRLLWLCRKYKLISVVCVPNLGMLKKVSKLRPNYLAYEPPALIGGKISVSEAEPEVIAKAVSMTRLNVLVGAGVNSHQDLKTALKLGAKGVLVASDIVKARSPRRELVELITGK